MCHYINSEVWMGRATMSDGFVAMDGFPFRSSTVLSPPLEPRMVSHGWRAVIFLLFRFLGVVFI